MARPGGKKKQSKGKTYTIDELSALAGEAWKREDAAKKLAEEERGKPREPKRARPHHGGVAIKHNPNLGGTHT